MNVDSYRRKEAVDKARGAGRPPTRATIKGSSYIGMTAHRILVKAIDKLGSRFAAVLSVQLFNHSVKHSHQMSRSCRIIPLLVLLDGRVSRWSLKATDHFCSRRYTRNADVSSAIPCAIMWSTKP